MQEKETDKEKEVAEKREGQLSTLKKSAELAEQSIALSTGQRHIKSSKSKQYQT